MLIHFICSGNTNRSRMAEAYFNSKKISNVTATSSGTNAFRNFNGPITFFAKNILQRVGILDYTAKTWQQTTKELLLKQDVVVFMKQQHFDYVRYELGYVPPCYYIWNINDVAAAQNENLEKMRAEEVLDDEKVFENIKQAVDKLITDLKL